MEIYYAPLQSGGIVKVYAHNTAIKQHVTCLSGFTQGLKSMFYLTDELMFWIQAPTFHSFVHDTGMSASSNLLQSRIHH